MVKLNKVLARRVIILVIYVSLYTKISKRNYGILVISAIIAIAHAAVRPFKDTVDNILEMLSLTMLVYAASTKAVYPNGGRSIIYKPLVLHVCV